MWSILLLQIRMGIGRVRCLPGILCLLEGAGSSSRGTVPKCPRRLRSSGHFQMTRAYTAATSTLSATLNGQVKLSQRTHNSKQTLPLPDKQLPQGNPQSLEQSATSARLTSSCDTCSLCQKSTQLPQNKPWICYETLRIQGSVFN
jgi:hypothetical protein